MRLRPPRPETVALLAQAWCRLLLTSMRVRLSGSPPLGSVGVASDARGPGTHAPAPSGGASDARRIAWAIARVAPAVPGAACLAQAIAAHDWLTRRGVPTAVRLGVRRSAANTISAHAWLAHEDEVVLGEPDAPYVTLNRRPPAPGKDR
jgi:hypothetical protein